MSIPVPTLSTQGWVTDLSSKIDYLLSHFFVSDFKQTHFYPGTITSLPEMMQKTGGDPQLLMPELKNKLLTYLTKYYEAVTVEVLPTVNLASSTATRIELVLRIDVTDDGEKGAFARLLKTENSKLARIMALNNDDVDKLTGQS